MKPRIAIPTPNSDPAYAEKTLPQYASAVERAGGEPVEIPIAATPTEIAQVMKSCDALLLPGSPADVDPQKFDTQRHPKTSVADRKREDADELCLQDAYNMRKPILGICYGLQSLNVWRTGTLVQHIESQVRHSRPDDQPKSVWITHPVVVAAGSKLAQIVGQPNQNGSPKITVNSSHHQSIEKPGDGLKVVARSPEDGIVEALETTSPEHFVLAVQWHPERSFDEDEPSKAIFRALVDAATQWHRHMLDAGRDFEALRTNESQVPND